LFISLIFGAFLKSFFHLPIFPLAAVTVPVLCVI
jgi:hypothetical protein